MELIGAEMLMRFQWETLRNHVGGFRIMISLSYPHCLSLSTPAEKRKGISNRNVEVWRWGKLRRWRAHASWTVFHRRLKDSKGNEVMWRCEAYLIYWVVLTYTQHMCLYMFVCLIECLVVSIGNLMVVAVLVATSRETYLSRWFGTGFETCNKRGQ